MNDDTDRTAARLRAALTAAADVMTIRDAPEHQQIRLSKPTARRNWGRLAPLAAAAGIAVIAGGTVIGAHLASPARSAHATGGRTQSATSTGTAPGTGTSTPEFYLTVTYPASGQNVLQFQVRRTNGGAVTGEKTISAANVGWGGYLAAGPDGTFYFAHYVCSQTVDPATTFDRITITSGGQIKSFAPAGSPVPGMVTAFAVNPDGTQVAYNELPGLCATTGKGFLSSAAAAVKVTDLASGTTKTWQDSTTGDMVGRVSWASNGRTLIVDEHQRGAQRSALAVYALDTDSGGGTLQAHSTTLLQQNANCTTCVTTAVAGQGGTLTELESSGTGAQTRVRLVSVPATAGGRPTVLYTGPAGAPSNAALNTDLFTDPSGRWPLLWPSGSLSPRNQEFVAPGWVGSGKLHPLTGLARVFPQGVAW